MNKLRLCGFILALASCATQNKNGDGSVTFFIDESRVTDTEVREDFYSYYWKSKKWIDQEFDLPTGLVKIGHDPISKELGAALQKHPDSCTAGIYIDNGSRDNLICSAITDYDLYQILSE